MDVEESPRDRQEIEWPDTSPRRELRRRRPTRRSKRQWPKPGRRTREMLTLIGINAVVSLIISLVVVVVWDVVSHAPTPTPVADTTVMPTAPTPQPTATLTLQPGEPMAYRVQPGDTLLTIAAQFDVTVEEIMMANGLENPDFIQVGQELVIPIGGLPQPTPTVATVEPPPSQPTDTPQPTATSQPATPTLTPLLVTPPATEPEVVIREILGAGAAPDEAVFIFNSGRGVRMKGWTLTDAQDNAYTFPNLFLGTGGSVRVHTGSGSNSATDLYWGLDAPVWGEPGDIATLRDESGLPIDTFELP